MGLNILGQKRMIGVEGVDKERNSEQKRSWMSLGVQITVADAKDDSFAATRTFLLPQRDQ
jgi:hypothetical protein